MLISVDKLLTWPIGLNVPPDEVETRAFKDMMREAAIEMARVAKLEKTLQHPSFHGESYLLRVAIDVYPPGEVQKLIDDAAKAAREQGHRDGYEAGRSAAVCNIQDAVRRAVFK